MLHHVKYVMEYNNYRGYFKEPADDMKKQNMSELSPRFPLHCPSFIITFFK
jgi:hypothetical protein